MASSSQILAEYESLKNTKWYSADDFYNKSFVDEINNAQRNIDSLVKERDAVDSKKQQAEDSYNTFFGNMRNYSSMNDEAEDKFGVTTSMENYEKSRYAVAAMEQQLNTLPSTINRYAGRVMSKAQRDLAYNAAADKWTQTMDITRRQEDVNKQVWENARRNADIYAQQLYGQQKEDLQAISMQWSDQTSKYQKALDNIRLQEYKKLEWQTKYHKWQWQQAEDRNKRNMALREDAWNRYMIQLEYERIARLEANEMARIDSQLRAEESAKRIVSAYRKGQQNIERARIADAGGILGKLAYLSNM